MITYSAEPHEIGVPYIVMEKAGGVPLDDLLPQMPFEDRWSLSQKVLQFQKTLMSVHFSRYGALYFARDLGGDLDELDWLYKDLDGKRFKDSRFTIGICRSLSCFLSDHMLTTFRTIFEQRMDGLRPTEPDS